MVFRRLLICLTLFSSFFFLIPSSLAASQIVLPCYCFCTGKDGTFPLNHSGKEITGKDANVAWTDIMFPDKCRESCSNLKTNVAACAQKYEQFPINNRLCFTQKQCELENAKGETLGEWDGPDAKKQPSECMKGMFYCYPHVKKAEAKLSVPIGNLGITGDLGQYISVVYQWMLGAAAVIAIVMTLVGGLQYVTAGATEKIAEATTRIKNGVIGLVLLLCVVLIMTVVNPQLLTLKVPRLPLIRTLELGGNKSCEKYISEEYDVEPEHADKDQVCGQRGLVKSKAGKEVLAGTVCNYTSGCFPGSYCVEVPGKKGGVEAGPTCISCSEVTEGNKYGLTPTSNLCKTLSVSLGKTNGSPDEWRCGWTKDADVNNNQPIKAVKSGSCAAIRINCDEIVNCTDYDDIHVENSFTHAQTTKNYQPLEDVVNFSSYLNSDLVCGIGGCGDFDLKSICDENPCSVLMGGKVTEKACYYQHLGALLPDDCKGY